MKKYFLWVFVFLLRFSLCHAQDTIVLRNQDKIVAKDIDISKKVYYRYFHDKEGIWHATEKSDIAYIYWSDGSIQIYHKFDSVEQKAASVPVIPKKDSAISTIKDTTAKPFAKAIYFSAGIGASLFNSDFSNNFTNGEKPVIISQTPGIDAIIDYKFYRFLSIGLGFSYKNITDYPVVAGSVMNNETEFIQRMNYSMLVLCYPLSPLNNNMYCGFRFGITYWLDYPIYPSYIGQGSTYYYSITNPRTLSFLALVGYNAFITKWFGVHFETGFGTHDYAEAGITFKVTTCKPK